MPSPTGSPPPISPAAGVPGLRILGITSVSAAPGNRFAHGADIASGSTITVPDTSCYFHVTGTTTISYVSTTGLTDGVPFDLYFESACTVAHNAGSVPGGTVKILLSSGANAAMAAGKTLTLRYDAALTAAIQIGGAAASTGRLIGVATHISGTTASPPAGTLAMLVRGAAGGGGGGGVAAASTGNHRTAGAGGSAGGEIYFYTTNIPASYTFTLGAGGAAGSSGGGNGGDGGDLVFSDGTTTVTGFGGLGGEGETGDGTSAVARQGGAAPAASTNVSRPSGSQTGQSSFAVVNTTNPGGFSGSGGSGSFGTGGAGWAAGSNAGRAGIGNGSGGGGARDNGTGAKAGGVATSAILNIEFYS